MYPVESTPRKEEYGLSLKVPISQRLRPVADQVRMHRLPVWLQNNFNHNINQKPKKELS